MTALVYAKFMLHSIISNNTMLYYDLNNRSSEYMTGTQELNAGIQIPAVLEQQQKKSAFKKTKLYKHNEAQVI